MVVQLPGFVFQSVGSTAQIDVILHCTAVSAIKLILVEACTSTIFLVATKNIGIVCQREYI